MKIRFSGLALLCLATISLLTACGGGGGGSSAASSSGIYALKGQFQKGPFALGSAISVNELDENLNPTGIVYNIQTTDNLGNFSVASKVHSHLVEIIGDGFYMDELTGQLSTTRIQLRGIADLNVNPTVTVNILTSLQGQRLKTLITQGKTYTAANTQSQNEVLTAFGIDPTKVVGLSNLYSMKINGSTDQDSVLLAISTVLSQMATNAAATNATSQPAELSNYVNTIASQIQNAGTITSTAYNTARSLAATQFNLSAVRTNIETYYANRGLTIVAPKFEEWVDKDASGILPRRLVPDSGLSFINATGVNPNQLITSNTVVVSGLGAGVAAPVTVSAGTTIIKNNVAVNGTVTTAVDGDTIALRLTSAGFGLVAYSTISVGSTNAAWNVTTQPLSGTVSGLTSSGLVLQNNLGDNITIAPGSTGFSFPTSAANGATYSVTILSQPTSPLQSCAILNSSGTVGGGVANISITCHIAALAYVANGNSSNVAAFLVDTVTESLTSIGTWNNGGNSKLAMPPNGNYLYATMGSAGIWDFSINPLSGALTGMGSVITNPPTPLQIYFEPTGKFGYVSTITYPTGAPTTYSIMGYSVNSTSGALTNTFTLATTPSLSGMVFDTLGKFAFATFSDNTISSYTINSATGALTVVNTITGVLSAAQWMVASPTGNFIYELTSSSISEFSFNSTTGTISSIGSIATAGTNPLSMAIDLAGKYIFVGEGVTISSYQINPATGILSNVNTLTMGGGVDSIAIYGNFAFATDGTNSILSFSIDPVTGTLSSLGVTSSLGSYPNSILIK